MNMENIIIPQALDDYSSQLIPVSEGVWEYGKDSSNGCYISEASLREILFYLSNVAYSIISPVLPQEPISHNVERLASLRASIQGERIPFFQIVGRWQEEESDTFIIDKGYILIKPDQMTKEEFSFLMQQAIKAYGQDAFPVKIQREDMNCIDQEGNIVQAYSGDIGIDLLAKAYSFRLPIGKRFSFIGLEIPNGSISCFQLFKGSGVGYFLPKDFFERKESKAYTG